MTGKINGISRTHFFFKPIVKSTMVPAAQSMASKIRELPDGISLFLNGNLGTNLRNLSADNIAGRIGHEKLPLAQAVIDTAHYLKAEIKDDTYVLEDIMAEIGKMPQAIQFSSAQFEVFEGYRKKGMVFEDLPETVRESITDLVETSKSSLDIAPEYLLGNLNKALYLMRRFGVRDKIIGLNNLFERFVNEYIQADLSNSQEIGSFEIIERAKDLKAKGVAFEVYQRSAFNKGLDTLEVSDLDAIIGEIVENNENSNAWVSESIARKFIDATLTKEERRLLESPKVSIAQLMSFFKFPESESETVKISSVANLEDPLQWKKTELGKAVSALRRDIDWLATSAGVKAAGGIQPAAIEKIERIKELAQGHDISLLSGRGGILKVNRIGNLETQDIMFDLHCFAVLEKKSFDAVVETALDALEVIQRLGNRDVVVDLNDVIRARLKGEPYFSIMGTQGIILRNSPIAEAREKLNSFNGKVSLTVRTEDGENIPVAEMEHDQFKRAMILMGRGFQRPRGPERVLGTIMDRIVPEITWLPKAVIQEGYHDLGRIVELTIEGIPARYLLRREWDKINLDNFAFMGSSLSAGIRNCLDCTINSIFLRIVQAGLGVGFDEIKHYEATGCFEVFSGIWPYTGKGFPTLHVTFEGVGSEMLGGIAAKMARIKFKLKKTIKDAVRTNKDLKNEIVNLLRNLERILHLGTAGDGAVLDIGFANFSGLFARLQKIIDTELRDYLVQRLRLEGLGDHDINALIDEVKKEVIIDIIQRVLVVLIDNEGYQNTGNQYSAGTPPGMSNTTNPAGKAKPMGNVIPKKRAVEIFAEHGIKFSARMGIHRPEHMVRAAVRALQDGDTGAFLHILQPCTTGWKFNADNIAYDISALQEEYALFIPITIEHGVPYLENYPVPRDPAKGLMELNARLKHLGGQVITDKTLFEKLVNYHEAEKIRILHLTGYDSEIMGVDRFDYLEGEHRIPKLNIAA